MSAVQTAMAAARFIVCEKTGRWAAALRRSAGELSLRIYETRSLVECWEELAASPASFLALEATADNIESLLPRLADLGRTRPAARAILLAARGLEPHQWLLREAGAVHVLFSPRRLAGVLGVAARHLERAPRETTSFRESLWVRLPWNERGVRAPSGRSESAT